MNQELYEKFCHEYEKKGLWEHSTHGSKLKNCAEKYGERIALIDEQEEISYQELDLRSDQMAAWMLHEGFVKGERIVIQHVNCIGFAVMCFAMFKIGVIPVLAMPSHGMRELSGIVKTAQPKGFIVIETYHGVDHLAEAAVLQKENPCIEKVIPAERLEQMDFSQWELDEELYEKPCSRDTAILVLSGGSTGIPKLIARPHADYLHLQKYCALSCGMDENSVSLIAMPVTHCWNLCGPGLLGSLFAGAKTVLCRNGSADEILNCIEMHKVTTMALVPSLLRACISLQDLMENDLSSLQMIQIGGAMCPPQLAELAVEKLGCKVQQIYGMSEGFVSATRPEDPYEIMIGTQGIPVSPGDIMKIVDEEEQEVPAGEAGEILARGPSVVWEYYENPVMSSVAFTEDGFYRTGDKGRIDPDTRRLQILGRIREQINRLGEKIMPSELEEYLLDHPQIQQVCVVPADDEKLGQRICICLPEAHSGIGLTQLRQFLKEKEIASFKMPDQVIYIREWPYTAVNKIDRGRLREMAEGKVALC